MTEENKQQLLEIENSYWECMDEETKDLCQKTIEEVKKLMPKDSNVSLLSDVPEEVSTKICEAEGVNINTDLLKQATNPMALAKYLRLVSDNMKICAKVERDLENTLDKKSFDWFVSKNFDNLVVISKVQEINSEEKPKSLSLKYKYNPEEDKIIYSLLGQTWNWEISKDLLLAILGDKNFVTTDENKDSCNLKDTISLTVGDVIISVKRK